MKIIVGLFTTKPGRRAEYLDAAQDYLRKSRLDPDCLYIELVPMPDHSDRILLAEAFTDEAAHRCHEDTDHMRALEGRSDTLIQCRDRQRDQPTGGTYRRKLSLRTGSTTVKLESEG